MKNKLVLDKNDETVEFSPLVKIELNDTEYIIYTKHEKNDCGDTICYASSYHEIDGKQILEPIEDESTLEFLDGVLMQVQEKMNRDESSEKKDE